MRRVVEELDGEAERVLGPDGRADPRRGSGRHVLGPAAKAAIEVRRAVQIGGRAHAEGQAAGRGIIALREDQVVMGQLVIAAQVQHSFIGLGDDEPEQLHPEPAGPGQVGDDQLGVRGADDVWGRRRRGTAHDHEPPVPNRGTPASSSAT